MESAVWTLCSLQVSEHAYLHVWDIDMDVEAQGGWRARCHPGRTQDRAGAAITAHSSKNTDWLTRLWPRRLRAPPLPLCVYRKRDRERCMDQEGWGFPIYIPFFRARWTLRGVPLSPCHGLLMPARRGVIRTGSSLTTHYFKLSLLYENRKSIHLTAEQQIEGSLRVRVLGSERTVSLSFSSPSRGAYQQWD